MYDMKIIVQYYQGR